MIEYGRVLSTLVGLEEPGIERRLSAMRTLLAADAAGEGFCNAELVEMEPKPVWDWIETGAFDEDGEPVMRVGEQIGWRHTLGWYARPGETTNDD